MPATVPACSLQSTDGPMPVLTGARRPCLGRLYSPAVGGGTPAVRRVTAAFSSVCYPVCNRRSHPQSEPVGLLCGAAAPPVLPFLGRKGRTSAPWEQCTAGVQLSVTQYGKAKQAYTGLFSQPIGARSERLPALAGAAVQLGDVLAYSCGSGREGLVYGRISKSVQRHSVYNGQQSPLYTSQGALAQKGQLTGNRRQYLCRLQCFLPCPAKTTVLPRCTEG